MRLCYLWELHPLSFWQFPLYYLHCPKEGKQQNSVRFSIWFVRDEKNGSHCSRWILEHYSALSYSNKDFSFPPSFPFSLQLTLLWTTPSIFVCFHYLWSSLSTHFFNPQLSGFPHSDHILDIQCHQYLCLWMLFLCSIWSNLTFPANSSSVFCLVFLNMKSKCSCRCN